MNKIQKFKYQKSIYKQTYYILVFIDGKTVINLLQMKYQFENDWYTELFIWDEKNQPLY
jgi:hypothetical protein